VSGLETRHPGMQEAEDMPRIVKHDRMGPYKIEPGSIPNDRPIWICGCGLTKTFPFCDGSHKACRDEDPAKLYEYHPDGRREEIKPAQ
jgi:CDGSH-type Zn-finger protein